MSQAKSALAAMFCLVSIAQSAMAKLTIDDFEDGPFTFADYRGTGVVGADPASNEQKSLTPGHIAGGVRLVTLTANPSSVVTAALVPIVGADNDLSLRSQGNVLVDLVYDGIAGGATASGSVGALALDLSSYDEIVFEVAELSGSTHYLEVWLSDSATTAHFDHGPLVLGANEVPLASITGVDLTDIRQVRFGLRQRVFGSVVTTGSSVRVLEISAVSDPSPGSGLPAPVTLAPPHGGVAPQSASFSWTAVAEATGYRLAIGADPSALPDDPGATACAACSFRATTLPAHVQSLPESQVVWWRVQALPAGRWGEPVVFTTSGSIALAITSPLPGSSVEAASVIVRGLVTPPEGLVEVGIEVNGTVALRGPATFAATVPIGGPVTILTATARNASGSVVARHAVPVSVNVPDEDPTIRFSVAPDMGTAPFTAHFGFSSEVPLTLITLDADGNGVPDYAGQEFDDVTFTYAAPGLYEPTVTAVAEDGTTYSASAHVRVFTSAELDLLLKPKWDALKNALRAGNVATAVQQVLIRRRADYTASLNSLTIPLANIDQELTQLVFERQLGRNVDYEMHRLENGTIYSYPVVFTLDEDGIWRLGAF